MGRKPFLNLTFIVLLLTLLSMRQMILLTHRSEDNLTDSSESLLRDRNPFTRLDVDYIGGLSAPLTPVARALAQLWRRTMILAEWPIENNTTQWQQFYASSLVEKELIEARFHIENAEVYEWSVENPRKTVAELDRAERFLYDARPSINKPVLPTFERVTKELEVMKVDTNDKRVSQPANYESVKIDLDRVINWARTLGNKKVKPASSSRSS